jgi:hypothetical protein
MPNACALVVDTGTETKNSDNEDAARWPERVPCPSHDNDRQGGASDGQKQRSRHWLPWVAKAGRLQFIDHELDQKGAGDRGPAGDFSGRRGILSPWDIGEVSESNMTIP